MKNLTLLILALILCLLLTSCALCRVTALQDTERAICEGKQARVAAYAVGGDGVIAAFPDSIIHIAEYGFAAHVQAQIWDEGRWKWLQGGSLSDESTYSRQRILPDGKGGLADYYYFSADEWRAFEAKQGRWMPKKRACK